MLQTQIEDILLEGVTKRHFPGAHYAVVYGDNRLIKGYVGYKRTHPKTEPLHGDELYDVASLTKVIATTTMIMKLIDQHQLRLDTNVADILPQFHHNHITVADLLTHSSGLPADIPRANTLRNKDDVLSHVYSVDLIYETGTQVVYSDIGFILLGLIVQAITKQNLHDVATRFIFEPLGMTESGYHPDRLRCAPTEYRDDTVFQGYLQGQVHDEKSFALGGNAGHAGLFSSTRDIAKFLRMYLTNDTTILKQETLDAMYVPRIQGTTKLGNPNIRAYGFNKPTPGGTAGDLIDPVETILHTGFTGCNLWIDRTHQVAFVLLSNAVHPKRELNGIIPYRRRLANLILSSLKEDTNEKTV